MEAWTILKGNNATSYIYACVGIEKLGRGSQGPHTQTVGLREGSREREREEVQTIVTHARGVDRFAETNNATLRVRCSATRERLSPREGTGFV